METCKLCELTTARTTLGSLSGEPNLRGHRVYEDGQVVVLLVWRAGQEGQLLVVPKTHAQSLEALGEALQTHLFKISRRATDSLGDAGMDFANSQLAVVAEDSPTQPHVYLTVSPHSPQPPTTHRKQ